MDLVKHLRLQDPLFLFAAARETIGPVTQWAVGLAIEHLGDIGDCETAVS